MRIYKHWVKVEENFTSAENEVYTLYAWGYSNQSLDDAKLVGEKKIKVLKAFHSEVDDVEDETLYADYFERPKPEEILSDSVMGDPATAIIRNRYGAEILCSEKLCFVDLDYQGLWAKLGLKSMAARSIKARVHKVMGKNNEVSYRLYETKNGFRLVLLDRPYEAESEFVRKLMTSLGADRLYVRMCRAQECFRARLTPKPWRCGIKNLPPEYPTTKPGSGDARNRWVSDYTAKSANYSTCKLVETVGQDRADPQLLKLCLDVHDAKCRVRFVESALA